MLATHSHVYLKHVCNSKQETGCVKECRGTSESSWEL